MLQKSLIQTAKGIKLTKYLDYKKYLEDLYMRLKEIEPEYTYIKYSQDLGFGNCNAVNLIINGRRPLTIKSAKKIASQLKIVGTDRQYFLKLIEFSKTSTSKERSEIFDELSQLKSKTLPNQLDKKKLEFYLNWYNAAILEILATEHGKDCPTWISKKLFPKVTELKVKKSLDLLKELDLIRFCQHKERYIPSQETFTTGDEVMGMAIIGYHQEMIEMGKQALTKEKADNRDISSITISYNSDQIIEIKQHISNFRKQLLILSNASKDVDTIYQMNFQLFPLVKDIKKDS